MKKPGLILIFLLTIYNNSKSQQSIDSSSAKFFNLVISDYFSSRHSQDSVHYFIKDSIPAHLKKDYHNYKLTLIDYPQAYHLIKKNEISSIFWARMKQIDSDTIDIIIGGWTVDFERVFRIQKVNSRRKIILRNYNFKAWDGGTLGYIPNGRFIYNSGQHDWQYFPQDYLIKEKLKRNKK